MNGKLLIPLCALPLAAHAAQKTTERPNIILFLVDDMGWQDTSVPFWTEQTPYNRLFETPNMERLAAKGTLFTQAYASSISSPSRSSLLTGSNAARHRVTNWTLERGRTTDAKNDLIEVPDWNYNGVQPVARIANTYPATSFVSILKQNGYHTIHCGKAHFGAIDTPGEDPHAFGFDVNIAGHAAGGPASYLSEENFGNRTDGAQQSLFAIPGLEKYWHSGTFLSEALTLEALKALDKAKKYEQPFFLYMSHYAVHVPIDRDPRYFGKYKERGLSDREAAYAALVEGMDKSLGDLLDWLDANGEADNTIVIFMSDNGGLAVSPDCRDGAPHTQNAPLSSGKGSAREGGIREPMIVCWPGVTAGGSRCDKYVIIEDFYPTILEMAGIRKYTTVQPVDGISFVPLLSGKGDPSHGRSLYWNCPNLWGPDGPGIGPTCTIRRGDWKLIYYYADGHKELFNIRTDIGEQHGLAAEQPARVKELSRRLGRYLRRVDAQRPTFKTTGKPCPWSDETATTNN